ncbi:MAG: hypothetical protein ABI663_02575 [Chryseolinea sp.]
MKYSLRKITSVLILSFMWIHSSGQNTSFTKLGDLPPRLFESSGLEYTRDSTGDNVWTIVDSNLAILFCLDSTGQIKKAIHLNNVNHGWEDLSQDDQGNFYIGDFGNNFNKRKDLKIYKIPSPDSIKEKVITAEIIQFHYPDQHEFPPKPHLKNFDMDAMVCFGNSIYLFSKNSSTPFTGYTKMYRLPNAPGNYTAELVDSLYLGPGYKYNTWVTGADLSPDKKTLAILTQDKVWLFTCFKGDAFLKGKKQTIQLNHFSQKEGICFRDNETLFISDERTENILGGSLYTLKLNKAEHDDCK